MDDRKEAFARLYRAAYGPVVGYLRRRLDSQDVEDALGDVFLVAWRRLEDVPDGDEAILWLFGVARNVVQGNRRGGRRRERLLAKLASGERPEDAVSMDSERVDEALAVRSALGSLRSDDQEILRLSEWEQLSNAQLAQVLKCSVNAATIRLHRATKRFRQAMRSAKDEPGLTEQGKMSR